MADSAIIALGTTPIPGDAPSGVSMRYDDAYTQLETELAKLDNPAGGEVDWPQVSAGCIALITDKSKDVLVAAWLTRALFQRQRLDGLATGLGLITGLFAAFWDTCHPQPPRLKARRGALEWMSEKIAPLINAQDAASPQGRSALDDCRKRIDDLIKLIGEKFAPDDSGLGTIKRRLAEFGAAPAAPAAATTSATAPTAMAAVAVTSAAQAQPSAAPSEPAGPVATRAEAIAKLQEIAEFFSRTEPHSPIGFLIARAVAWNAKSFQEIYSELLKGKADAQTQLWDALGMKPPASK